MMNFTTLQNKNQDKTKKNKPWQTVVAIAFWIGIWQIASLIVKQSLILPSPLAVLSELKMLVVTTRFWSSVGFSLSRVALGFLLSFTLGVLFAILAYKVNGIRILFHPFMSIIKAAPVAAYIILCFLLLSVRTLPLFISFLMGFPIIYESTLQGLWSTNQDLLEMAQVFRVSRWKKITYIYLSELMPFLVSAASLSIGLSWKAGIAAEVISIPRGSIGEHFYQAKIHADTTTVLAWTVVVIAISFLFERLFLRFLRAIQRKAEQR